MNWTLIFSIVAVVCLGAAALSVTVKALPRLSLGWLGLTIWAVLVLF